MRAREYTRRSPQQARSKELVERFLKAARELIGKRGNDAVSIREVAAHADVPISSVYDYFPDRTAIIRALMVGYMDEIDRRLTAVLSGIGAAHEIPDGADRLVDAFVDYFREERELGPIWAAVQANAELRSQDVRSGHRIADLVAARFIELSPRCDAAGVRSLTLYVVDTIVAIARIATVASPHDGPGLIAELKILMRLRFTTLLPELRPNAPSARRGSPRRP